MNLKTNLFFCIVILLTFLVTSQAKEYKLVLEENFNGPNLDRTLWDYEVNCWGGGNFEKQCYVNHSDVIFIENGILNIKPKYHPNGFMGVSEAEGCTLNFENSCQWTQPATSGRIRTRFSNRGSWLYGRFEVRARMPVGDFLWPAIWMLPTDDVYGSWARSGEIDILEFKGQEKNFTEHTLHYGGQWPYNMYKGSGQKNHHVDLTKEFHLYSFVWRPENLTWYLDNTQVHTHSLNYNFSNPNYNQPYEKLGQPFDQRFHLLINLAVAGSPYDYFNMSKYGEFNAATHSATWTQPYQIDYVKVYQMKDKDDKDKDDDK